MVNLVLDEAGFSNASLQFEGVLVSVSSSRHNGSLTNFAHHQNLCIILLRQHVQSSSEAPVTCGRSKALHGDLFAMSAGGLTQLISNRIVRPAMQSTAQVQAGELTTDGCKRQKQGTGTWPQVGAGGRGRAEDKGIGESLWQGQGAEAGAGAEGGAGAGAGAGARGTIAGLTRCRLLRWLWSTCQLSLSSKLKARGNLGWAAFTLDLTPVCPATHTHSHTSRPLPAAVQQLRQEQHIWCCVNSCWLAKVC